MNYPVYNASWKNITLDCLETVRYNKSCDLDYFCGGGIAEPYIWIDTHTLGYRGDRETVKEAIIYQIYDAVLHWLRENNTEEVLEIIMGPDPYDVEGFNIESFLEEIFAHITPDELRRTVYVSLRTDFED